MEPTLDFQPFGAGSLGEIRHEISNTTIRRSQVSTTLTNLRRSIDAFNPELAMAVHVNPAQNLDDVFGSLAPILTPIVNSIRAEAAAHARHVQCYAHEEETYNALSQALVGLNQKLARYTARAVRMTQSDVNAALAKVPGVRGEILATDTVLLIFKDIVMTPDYNQYANINNGERVSLYLGDINASVNLSEGSLHITSEDLREGGFGARAHPHILSYDKPCLGGFEGTYYDACQKADIEVIALVLRMFLQQASSEDIAGRYWTRWMPLSAIRKRDATLTVLETTGMTLTRTTHVNLNKLGRVHSTKTVVYVKLDDRNTTITPTKNDVLDYINVYGGNVDRAKDILGDLPIILHTRETELW